jgi:predicted O-linked N-acetylglucosamine transferase (SPINDLY family)
MRGNETADASRRSAGGGACRITGILLSSEGRPSTGNSQLQSSVGSRAFQNARLQKQFRKQAEVLLPAAVAAYRQGKHAEAQALCQQILKDLPDHFDARYLLGISELDCRQFEAAEANLARAVSIEPRSAEARSNLGMALFNLKRYDDARKCQEKAIALKPNFPAALTNLGNTLMRLGVAEQAVDAHDRAIQLKPDYADAYCNRGMALLLLLNRNDEADQNFDRALSFQRGHLQAMIGKGMASLRLRHFDAAQGAFNAVLAVKPDFAEVLTFRARAHQEMGQLARAEADLDAALAVDPMMESAWQGKAVIKILLGDTASAIAACMKALEQEPLSPRAITMLGACYAQQGDIATAVEYFDRALAIKPDHEEAISKKIFVLDFAPGYAVQQAARRAWWDAIGARIPQGELRRPMPDPNKRIVVGYVSSDFRHHSAALGIKPVLRNHDRREFHVICYSCSPLRDAVTEECQSLVESWVDAAQFSDDELADRIQSDGVDILVDLSGHTAGNRLTVFARKPAPIQVTAFGSGTGTGMPTMDYLFTDPVTVPALVRHLYAEKIYDLPCVITTEALPDMDPTALPMIHKGHVTFGVFNRIDKISDDAIIVWSKLLQRVAGSIIVIKNSALDDPFLRDGLTGRFVAQGVSPDRIRCRGSNTRREHLGEFANIDISLDPFPHNGGVSTWESLQAGVPVVAKLGNGTVSRAGGAIVKAIGLDDWVAEDEDGYLAIAEKFASMPSHLEALRASLPARVATSSAGNGANYTRRVEQGYRQFWRDYCAAISPSAAGTPD